MEIIKREFITVNGIVKITKRNIYGKIIGVSTYKNIVTNKGLQLIGDLLIDDATEGITYFALGSNTTDPTVNDIKLGTETFRKQIAFRSRENQTITLSSYLTTSEANAIHKELGHFGNGATGVADSGDLFNHTEINETKTVAVTWTIEQTFTFANISPSPSASPSKSPSASASPSLSPSASASPST